MDPKLKEAACSGDVEFLRKAIEWSNEPETYFLSRFVPSDDDESSCTGNIFHLAVWHKQTEFVREAMQNLPLEILDQLLCQQETGNTFANWNPLHVAVSLGEKDLVRALVHGDFRHSVERFLAQDSEGRTPLLLAIHQQEEECALLILNATRHKQGAEGITSTVDDQGNSPLFLATKKRLPRVVDTLLDFSDPLGCTGPNGLTALHLAPRLANMIVDDKIYKKLLTRFKDRITATDNNGFTVLHKWVEIGNPQAIKYYVEFINNDETIGQMRAIDHKNGDTPLHLLANSSGQNGAIEIAKQLIRFYRKIAPPTTTLEATNMLDEHPPWLVKNNNGDTPLLMAIGNKREKLALCLLQEDRKNSLIASADKESPLTFAIHNGCRKLAVKIVGIIAKEQDLNKLIVFRDGSNILHSATALDYHAGLEEIIKEVVEKFPSLITQFDRDDNEGETPLDKASAAGKLWLVRLMVKKDPDSLGKARHAWQRACEEGHEPVIKLFIKQCPTFRGICFGCRDTPLHHMTPGKWNYAQYRELLDHKVIAEMINTQDEDLETPLHKAIRGKDKDLTEALLTMDDVDLHISGKDDKNAMDLLYENREQWAAMCKRVGIDLAMKTTFVQHRKDLLKIRETLLVVAALLATITFQAGFTLPGGLNNDSGEAILAKKAVFLVFLLADVCALCCSILVLFFLIWSILCESSKSIFWIDSSIPLLLLSLYASLVAFMTGVYTAISDKSLWAAITTIVVCSSIGISAVLYSQLTQAKGARDKLLLSFLKVKGIIIPSIQRIRDIYHKLHENPSRSETNSKEEASTSINKSSETNSKTNSKEEASTSSSKSSETNSKGEASTLTNHSSKTNAKEEASTLTSKSSETNPKGEASKLMNQCSETNNREEASTSTSKSSETNSKGEASTLTNEYSDTNSATDHIVRIE